MSKTLDSVDAKTKQVAMELAGNTTVTTLVLNNNRIDREGCADIANALIKNRMLVSIGQGSLVGHADCSVWPRRLLKIKWSKRSH
jgi:hypothetical protein